MEGQKVSSGSQETRAQVLGELARELRQFTGLGASIYRAAAAQVGMTATDLQVIDILDSAGPMTAGQIADLIGLTTGAITGMVKRLEEAGLVIRESDPNDGRRVIVRLASGEGEKHRIGAVFDSLGKSWEELASHYDDVQLDLLLEFLKRNNSLSREELARLRGVPDDEGGIFSDSLGDVTSGRLVIPSGISRLTLRGGDGMADLYHARFEGPAPDVKSKEGVVTIRYPRRLLVMGWGQRAAEVTLNAAIPWWIVIQSGTAELTAELGNLKLAGLEIKGGLWKSRLDLPVPSDVIPIRIGGGAAEITISRPAGVAARVHLKGWAADFAFDDQTFSAVGNDVQLQSQGYEGTAPCYDIDISGSASKATITAG
jgi:DNA-binding MarR family transcriptional regulator